MRKILNGLRYGNTKTKTYIITTMILLVFGTISLLMVISTGKPLWGMSMFFCYIFSFLISSSLSFHKSEKERNPSSEKEGKEKKTKTRGNQEDIEEQEEDYEEEEQVKPVDILEKYDKETVKGILVKYKVNKDHKPIMIDSCESQGISQCPAYVWLTKGELHLLLFEKESRKVTISLSSFPLIVYEKGALADPNVDYPAFTKTSFLSLVFQSYLPTTYEDNRGSIKNHRKNLYVIKPDLKVTNTSARTILDLLQAEPQIGGEFADPRLHNPYFEAAYKCSFMLRDGVMTVTEFKTKIKNLLKNLADAKINQAEFQMYINQMVSGRLITQEYADYYLDSRKKV